MEHVTLDKQYVTRNGRPVKLHEIALYNSAGSEVTFPVKGSVLYTTKTGRVKPQYYIWRLDGRAGNDTHPYDLIEVPDNAP